jgi:hypothetical protein
MLDDSPVTAEERQEAVKVYGSLDMTVSREKLERERIQELEKKRKEEKLAKRKRVSTLPYRSIYRIILNHHNHVL